MKEKYEDVRQDLIQSCRKNNRTAQLSIYKLYYKAMFNTSLRIVSNAQDAEDIMQESFLEAFRKISSFKGDGSFGGWLKRIVVNKSLDFVKARQGRISLGQKIMELETQEQEDDNGPADIDAQMEEVKAALEKLPENYRIILALFLMEGYDHQEIAQILGIRQVGSGDVNAYSLKAVSVEVSNSGSGDIVVHAIENLDVELNGSGDLTYTGSPRVSIESHGSGDVYRK